MVCASSSRDLPGGAVLAILEHHTHGGKFVSDAVGLGKVLCRTCSGSSLDEGVDSCSVNLSSPRMPIDVNAASRFEQSQEFCRRFERAFQLNVVDTRRRTTNLAGHRVKPRQRARRVEVVAKRL